MEIAQVTALMKQKKKALREFQAVTQKMLECSRDDLKKLVEKREHLIREMDRAEAEIQAQLTDLEEADPVRQAVAGTLEGTGHGEETEALFRLSREIRALLGQIREDDIQASLRLRVEQEQILDQIRTANQSSKAKAARFYSSAAARSRGGSRMGNASNTLIKKKKADYIK